MACPSQWDAWDAEGNYYYLRYRGGYGSVARYETENWCEDIEHDQFIEEVAVFEYGHPLDGSMTLEEFAVHAGIELAPSIERTAFWRNIKDKLTEEFAGDEAALGRVDRILGNVDLDQE
jgi:hypothetical protein